MPVNKPAAIARWCEVGDDRKAEYKKKWDEEQTKYYWAMVKYDKAMAKYRAQMN